MKVIEISSMLIFENHRIFVTSNTGIKICKLNVTKITKFTILIIKFIA